MKKYLDNGYSVILMDKTYFQKISVLILIRGMRNKIIRTDEYVIIQMFVIGTIKKKPIKILFFIEIHLVNELETNLLIKNDIFKF